MADTIRILVATDNHVGAHERDPVRHDDSWTSFDEVMRLAREKEVDMVLLAGDLFHENNPSRKSMYNVMRSLRQNCLGARPCELEMLGDGSELFDAAFDHVNYEDPDINISIPVFSIHGNHDDPTGDGHYSALDLLNMSGLVNYFGRIPQSDKIEVKPVLLQKGRTKLALYGLSNVRDERLYRTFRDEKVRFYQAGTQQSDWFHMICVHQNHHAHSETSYLPENFLPQFLDLVIWGHEHECDIQPHFNPEMNFHVMQPGSSVATSLVPGEAAPKHVTILSVSGREFKSEPIRLRTVRPFIYRDLILANDKTALKIGQKDDHRSELTRHLISIVENMISEGHKQWEEARAENPSTSEIDEEETPEPPLPLIRLRVDTWKPDGVSKFDVENPQRFSGRFTGRVANTTDVIQFSNRKKGSGGARAKAESAAEKEIMARIQNVENIKVEKLVKQFLEAQSLTILPQNYFGDAVSQFVDKDDRHALQMFVDESLANQISQLVKMQDDGDMRDADGEEDLATQIQEIREGLERDFKEGLIKARKVGRKLKPRPEEWDSDFDGSWADQPAAVIRSDDDDDDDEDGEGSRTPGPVSGRGRGRGRGRGTAARGAATARGRGAARGRAVAPATKTSRARKRIIQDDSDEEDQDDEEEEDVVMLDDDDDEEDENSQAMFFADKKPSTSTSTSKSKSNANPSRSSARAVPGPATSKARKAESPPQVKKPPARAGASTSISTAKAKGSAKNGRGKQGTLNFTTSQASILGSRGGRSTRSGGSVGDDIVDDDEDDDEEDAFEPVTQARGSGRRR